MLGRDEYLRLKAATKEIERERRERDEGTLYLLEIQVDSLPELITVELSVLLLDHSAVVDMHWAR